MTNDLITRLRARTVVTSVIDGSVGASDPLCIEAANALEKAQPIVDAAKAMRFGAYPAHGSGFVTIVIDGSVDALILACNPGAEVP